MVVLENLRCNLENMVPTAKNMYMYVKYVYINVFVFETAWNLVYRKVL